MNHQRLLNTPFEVSRISFGTMTFGSQTAEGEARRMVDLLEESGVNLLDTANIYNAGESEAIVGRVLVGRRNRFVLASKVRGKMGSDPDDVGLSAAAIPKAVDASLQRLQTDFLDICYFHQPDHDVPLEESLAAIDKLVRDGRVRCPALSNYSAWQTVQIFQLCERNGWAKPWVAQPIYNLIARAIENEFLPMAKALGIHTFVYNPLAGGLLTGKQPPDGPLTGTRFDGNELYMGRYWHPQILSAVEELKMVASASGRSMVSLALNWVLHHSGATGLILGASRMEQLAANLKACGDGPLPDEVVADCDGIWTRLMGPIPKYHR